MNADDLAIDINDKCQIVLICGSGLFRRKILMNPDVARDLAKGLTSAAKESERRTGKRNGEELELPPF